MRQAFTVHVGNFSDTAGARWSSWGDGWSIGQQATISAPCLHPLGYMKSTTAKFRPLTGRSLTGRSSAGSSVASRPIIGRAVISSRLGTTLLLASSLGLTAACGRSEPEVDEQVPTTDNVADEPHNFFGEKVTISGEVDDIYGSRAFELEDEMDLIFEDSVLVLTRSPVQFGGSPLADDDDVIITGTVRQFVSAKIESELEWDLDLEIEVDDYESKPVLVAESVRRVTEAGRWSEKEPEGMRVGWASVALEPEATDLAGTPLTLERVIVRKAQGKAAWVGPALAPVFVVAPEEVNDLEGRWADILGTVRPAPAPTEAAAQWKLDPEMTAGLVDVEFYLDASMMAASRSAPKEAGGATTGAIDYDQFTGERAKHIGKQVEGRAEVTKVFSDRAFYLSSNAGGEVLAIVREDEPQKEMIHIDPGQKLEFQARVLGTDDSLAGKLEDDAKTAIVKEPAFLSMHWRDVKILPSEDPERKAEQAMN